jgi:uncharacterized membrane protein
MILLGSGLRFTGLNRKQFWKDEASTAMITSGRCIYELFGDSKGGVYAAGSFMDLQKSASDRGFRNAFFRVLSDESTHSPLYYLASNVWRDVFGDSEGAIRSFSGFLSLALIPGIYFLCEALFESSTAGWIGALLTAVSPYQFLFAQEAREYILWLVITVWSSVALLKGLWRRYVVLCVIDIYSSMLAIFVAIGQVCFVMIDRGFKKSEKVRSRFFWWTRIGTLAISLPIIINMFAHFVDIRHSTYWMESSPGFVKYVKAVLSGLYRVFFDLNLPPGQLTEHPFQVIAIICILAGEAFALFYFFRSARRRSKLFIGILMITALLPTMGLDLILGGRRALSARFLLTFYLSLQLVVVYGLNRLFSDSDRRRRIFGLGTTIALSLLGLLSIYTNSQSNTWWNKGVTGDYRVMAAALSKAPYPLVIISHDYRESLALARYVDPTFQIMTAPPFPMPDTLHGWKSVFVLFGNPDDYPEFYEKQHVGLHQVEGTLWQLDLAKK